MATQENGNGKKSPKMKYMVASIVVVAVIVIASVGYVVFVKDDEDGGDNNSGDLMTHPNFFMNVNFNNSEYIFTVYGIEPMRTHNPEEWLKLEDVLFLLTNATYYGSNLYHIFINESHPENLYTGSIKEMTDNVTGDFVFVDADKNNSISIGDTITLRGSLINIINDALENSWGVRLLLIYNGDFLGDLSETSFPVLGYGEIRANNTYGEAING